MKRTFVVIGAVLAVALSATAGVGQEVRQKEGGMALRRSIDPLLSRETRKPAAPRPGAAAPFLPSEFECVASGGRINLNLDCDDPLAPNNEPHIVVNPLDPKHMVASSNDFDSCCDQFYTTFDGGLSWVTGDMSAEDPFRIGSDPVSSFDPKHGVVLHSSLNFRINEEFLADDGDLVVSRSRDGGVTWGRPVVVAGGIGDDNDALQIFNDKPWIVTDVNPSSPYYGRTYATWTRFRFAGGNFVESPIYEAHSEDGGRTWSQPKEISGANPAFCTFPALPRGRCNSNQFSVPTVAPNGTVYVAFQNDQHEAAWEPGDFFESQYLVVRSTDGGATFSDPVHVVDLEDGTADYPVNVSFRQTLTGYQIRVNSAGNIVANPRNGRLYLVFADNRAGLRDRRNPVTNTNVYVMNSMDGVRWNGPHVVSDAPNDQWFPWADVNPLTGEVGVLYNDRSIDPSGVTHGATLARGVPPGAFAHRVVSTQPSHPRNSFVFNAGIPSCFFCSLFHGDYIALAYGSDGAANMAWTDMRRFIDLGEPLGFTENIFFARLP